MMLIDCPIPCKNRRERLARMQRKEVKANYYRGRSMSRYGDYRARTHRPMISGLGY